MYIFCIGQGDWEWDGLPTQRVMDKACKEKGIHCWFDYWGYDVSHDWPWWRKQALYFLPKLIEAYEKAGYRMPD